MICLAYHDCSDFVQCHYKTRERAIKIDILKACHLDVIFVKYSDRYRFILYIKRNKSRQKV